MVFGPRKATSLLLLLCGLFNLTASSSLTATKSQRLIQTNDIERAHSGDNLSPVILLPGDGGSRLQAKLNRQEVPHHYCERRSSDWFDLWLNLSLLVPFAFECWADNMKLVYNATSRRTENTPGVAIRVGGFGQCESVEFVDGAKIIGTSYFEALVKRLVSLGYERNKNIFGAPYDFRRAPNELDEFFHDLKQLVERSYADNNNEPIVFICHSMGCLHGLYFLNHNSQAWKDKYIRSIISLSGVWGGSVKALKAFASGDNFGMMVIPPLSLRKDFRTFPSLAYLLPSQHVWPKDQVLVKNRNKSYTVNDYKQFFDDIGYPTGYEMWLDVRNLTVPTTAPGVEVHCLYGDQVTTMEKIDYQVGAFPDTRPHLKFGDGDGTVNLLSLQTCMRWTNKQKQRVQHRNFKAIDHMNILSNELVLEYIGEALVK